MKHLVIIAGPNGSGKSTLATQIDLAGDFINADKCEKNFLQHIKDKQAREQQATLMVAREISEHIKQGLSFSFETVFATTSIPSFIVNAKEKGYMISLHYIATESSEINIERVAKRVSEGGHDIPIKKIKERYEKTLSILPELIGFCDKVFLYDNSEKTLRPFLVKEKGEIKNIDVIPEWAKKVLNLF